MSRSKVAIVTGGTRGIGKAITLKLLELGYKVTATYLSNDKSAEEFKKSSGANVVKWDVTNFQACKENILKIEEEFGHIEVLVNNAGIISDSMMHKMTEQQWQSVIQTNLCSCFNMSRAVIEKMREKGSGRIVNIASVNALAGQLGQTNYSATKAGIIGFTKALALETASKGITVNAIAPGYIKTEMTQNMKEEVLKFIVGKIPVGRMGNPEEIANALAFLISENSSFITGTTLNVNGGQYMQ